jgi:glutathione S-transferase
VYSHRSTQRHKRKRFVSHYWDCRLKGRPPGTKKSTDPDKKKRKRVARERDLCDVKIKITEYFDGAELTEQTGQQPPMDTMDGNPFFGQPQQSQQSQLPANQQMNPWGVPNMGENMPLNQSLSQPVGASKKFYTIQRVNGNGGNGKGDGVAGPHKHSLAESDKVKKNSVIRWMLKSERDKKKVQVRSTLLYTFPVFHLALKLLECRLSLPLQESLGWATKVTIAVWCLDKHAEDPEG